RRRRCTRGRAARPPPGGSRPPRRLPVVCRRRTSRKGNSSAIQAWFTDVLADPRSAWHVRRAQSKRLRNTLPRGLLVSTGAVAATVVLRCAGEGSWRRRYLKIGRFGYHALNQNGPPPGTARPATCTASTPEANPE